MKFHKCYQIRRSSDSGYFTMHVRISERNAEKLDEIIFTVAVTKLICPLMQFISFNIHLDNT